MIVMTTIAVEEIHCDNCVRTIHQALMSLPGVRQVILRAGRRDVRVLFDAERMDEERLRSRLAEVGYNPVAQGGA